MTTNNNTTKPKLKKCKVCPSKFSPFSSTQQACSTPCAIELVKINTANKERKLHAKAKKNLKDNDKSFQFDKTQVIFNKFIRVRDAGHVCISCQKPPRKKNAGHYLSRGASPELRFEELNCHLQCEHCNSFKSGNQALYRFNLITKIGQDKVDWLEGPHEPKRYTLDELKELQQEYKTKTKELEA